MMQDEQPVRWRWARALGRFFAISGLVCLGLGLLGFWGLGVYLEDRLPPIKTVSAYIDHVPKMSRVYDAKGGLIGTFWVEKRSVVREDALPKHVMHAAVAAEDGDFYSHGGIDFLGMLRALYVNLKAGRYRQGASTITQQLARTFYLSAEKTLMRKFKELFLARKLERHLTKNEILLLYLNQVYFGQGRYGVQEAARHYFGRDVSTVSVGEAALLMAVLPSPERLNPFANLEACLKRRRLILGRMRSDGFIDERTYRIAVNEAIRLRPGNRAKRPDRQAFIDLVRRRVTEALGMQKLLTGGLQIHTTLLPHVQDGLNSAVANSFGSEDKGPQVAMVFLDPQTRGILGLIGGRPAGVAGFNRAFQARRQAGSTFKTFIYGAGLESGALTIDSKYKDSPVTYRGAGGKWSPKNAGHRYSNQMMSIEQALAASSNVVAVKALKDVGVSSMASFARRLGITSAVPRDLSAALGSASVSPLELANAYATLASGGIAGKPYAVTRVEGPDGELLYSESPKHAYVLSREVADHLTTMLERAVNEGTGQKVAIKGLAVAGKTGTTNGNIDAWFVGYTHDVVGTVWVGYDKPRKMPGISGPSLAAPLWRAALIYAMQGHDSE